jgi:energy-coupling factor transporter ATP-binding protein EcfA2
VSWGYETYPGYFAQDHREEFASQGGTAEQWVWSFCPERDFGWVRGAMGAMLFSGDDGTKALTALSGGETTRLVFTRLAIERPNVLVLDEPTNHLDLESIEALVEGLKAFPGTLILVSHDRWFVSQLATRVLEIRADGVRDYPGTYEEYVHACGDDHLDVDAVVLRAKQERKRAEPAPKGRPAAQPGGGDRKKELAKLRRRLAEVTDRIQAAEARLAEIDALFCRPDYFATTPAAEMRVRRAEREGLEAEIAALMAEWERLEGAIGADGQQTVEGGMRR